MKPNKNFDFEEIITTNWTLHKKFTIN